MRVPELLRHRAVREWGPGSRSSVHVFISPENYRFARQLVMGRLLGEPRCDPTGLPAEGAGCTWFLVGRGTAPSSSGIGD
jgi:hypothetical protein